MRIVQDSDDELEDVIEAEAPQPGTTARPFAQEVSHQSQGTGSTGKTVNERGIPLLLTLCQNL